MTENLPVLVAATDGSALGNPGPAAWCYYVDSTSWAAGGFEHSTNNVGELHAVYELLAAVPPFVPLQIRADSQYVVKALYGMDGKPAWIKGWKRKGWKTGTGKDVANQNLIRAIDLLMSARTAPLSFVWVKAHVAGGGDTLNEAADLRAFAAANAVKLKLPVLEGPGFTRTYGTS